MGYMCLKCIQRGMYLKCKIHAGYMWDNGQSRYMLDTSGIHARCMYLKCIQRGMYLICRRHAGYIRDTCRIHVSSEAITIHTGYIRDSCGINAEYMRDRTRISGVRGNVSMSSSCAAHLSGHPLPPCVQMGLLQPLELPHHLLCHGNPYPC
jgi:hypothetical protein